MRPELNRLIELQEIDLDIQRIADRLQKIPAERDQIEAGFNQQTAEFLKLKSEYQKAIDDRKALEAELSTTQQHHDKYKQDLMRVRNEKEYSTALREIDATKKQIGTLETEILRRMEEIENLEARLNALAPDVERKRAEVDLNLTSLDRERDEANHQLDALAERRKLIADSLSKPLFATYDRMSRTRRGQALAEIRSDGICSACRVKVRPKVFSDVRKGEEMIICESCGRILYYRPEHPQSAEATMSQQES
ncbi:MAG: C4-type zinc ribbon domain-containing protein [Blastocatellia bacterium]|nr:C4-type zinc ribbon domain-containing protein [Blastocatellia bacterium]